MRIDRATRHAILDVVDDALEDLELGAGGTGDANQIALSPDLATRFGQRFSGSLPPPGTGGSEPETTVPDLAGRFAERFVGLPPVTGGNLLDAPVDPALLASLTTFFNDNFQS